MAQATAEFEVYKDKVGETRVRIQAINGKYVFYGEGYSEKQSADEAIEWLITTIQSGDYRLVYKPESDVELDSSQEVRE